VAGGRDALFTDDEETSLIRLSGLIGIIPISGLPQESPKGEQALARNQSLSLLTISTDPAGPVDSLSDLSGSQLVTE
jgi:hypothetical protein